jgi:hypothetical protein
MNDEDTAYFTENKRFKSLKLGNSHKAKANEKLTQLNI